MAHEGIGEGFGEDRLTVFSRDGTVLSRSTQQDIYRFDWLPDGRLVYAVLPDRSIYITNAPHSTAVTSVLKSFSSTEGVPGWVVVSPNGQQLAFELVSEFAGPFSSWRHATVWTMNIDGSGLTQLATDRRGRPLINTPVWSPDSQWVSVLQGSKSGISFVPDPIETNREYATVSGVAGSLFSIKTNSGVPLVPENNDLVKPLFRVTSDDKKTYLRTSYDSSLLWLPALSTPLSSNRGSLPVTNSSRHRGLSGQLYFADSVSASDISVLDSLNLSNSVETQQFAISNDDLDYVSDLIYVSDDAQWVSQYFNDTFDPSIKIYNASGVLQRTIPLEGASLELVPQGPTQFSPINSDWILFKFTFYQSGRFYQAMVVNWRTGDVIETFSSQQFIAADWTPDGHILLADEDGDIYQALFNGSTFSTPALLFQLADPVQSIAVNPSGDRIAMHIQGQIWTSRLDGSDLKRLTAPSEHFFVLPEWSPDGRYIALKAIDSDNNARDLGDVWIVAADAENVDIRYPFDTEHAIPVLEADGDQMDIFGTFRWR